jgi:hypothetical protein
MSEERREFASAMNYAVQHFHVTLRTNLEVVSSLFKAYVEGEKLLHRDDCPFAKR